MIKRTTRLSTPVNISPTNGINREADFRRHAFVYYVISDVPWEEDESAAFDGDIKAITKAVELGLNRRGEHINKIPFEADRWIIDDTSFLFSGIGPDLGIKVRMFVLYEIIDHQWKAYATIASHLKQVRRFFLLYGKYNPDFLFSYVHVDDVARFFEMCDLSSSAKAEMIRCLILFYKFIKINYKKERFPMDMGRLEELRAEAVCVAKSVKGKKEYPTIPGQLFYPIHFKCMELIRDPMTPFDDKVVACMIIIFAWTGLRKKEVRLLRRRCLVERTEQGVTLSFYEYRSPKNGGKVQSCLLFPAAKEAFRVLEGLQIRHEVVNKTDYLISFWDNLENTPESSDAMQCAYDDFCVRNLSGVCSHAYEGMSRIERRGIVIYRPSFYCFRVHLCTYLIDHGYDERWVEAHLGHISPMMRGKYYRRSNAARRAMIKKLTVHVPFMSDAIRTLAETLSVPPQETSVNESDPIQNIIDNIK